MQESLGRKLRLMRAERGLSLREAARRAGVVKETISEIERGKTHPYDVTLAKLAHAYDVPLTELLEEPVPLGEAPPETRRLPEWARTSDMSTFSERVSRLPLDELKRLAVDLVSGERILTREDLRALSPEERGTRFANFARAMVLHEEFREQGVAPPPEFEVAYRRHLEALASPPTPDEEAQRPAPGIPEAG
jgi:transcriptional regulator with XRE-family HTH domain